MPTAYLVRGFQGLGETALAMRLSKSQDELDETMSRKGPSQYEVARQ